MGIIMHLIWMARNNLIHTNISFSLSWLCKGAKVALGRINKPFRSTCLESIFGALNLPLTRGMERCPPSSLGLLFVWFLVAVVFFFFCSNGISLLILLHSPFPF